MSIKEFDMSKIEGAKKEYGKEAEERWGTTEVYKESAVKTGGYNKEDWERISKEAEEIYEGFVQIMEEDPSSDAAKELVAAWQAHINRSYYTCSDEILAGLGEMYLADERFRQNIDQRKKGLAEFMARAISAYCGR